MQVKSYNAGSVGQVELDETPFYDKKEKARVLYRTLKDAVVMYEANRIDQHVAFTHEACEQLTGIPKAFLKQALQGIAATARKRGVETVDLDFVQALNAERDA